jgi:hypothetical protein
VEWYRRCEAPGPPAESEHLQWKGTINEKTSTKTAGNAVSILVFTQSGLERKARDSCGKYVSKGDPTGAKGAEEAPGPPAESERLQWKETVVVQTL